MSEAVADLTAALAGPVGRRVVTRRTALLDVLGRYGVSNARLFGSVARGEDQEDSDVDVLVDFAPGTGLFTILRIQAELEEILGTEVDLVPDGGLKAGARPRVERELIAL